MRSSLSVCVALCALLIGCKDSTRPAGTGPTMAGHWTGTFTAGEPWSLDLTLTQTDSILEGSGTIADTSRNISVKVFGSYSEPNVTLALAIYGFSTATVTGTCDSAETVITGAIAGSGFAGQAVTLYKR